jgi:hypothetical protein
MTLLRDRFMVDLVDLVVIVVIEVLVLMMELPSQKLGQFCVRLMPELSL